MHTKTCSSETSNRLSRWFLIGWASFSHQSLIPSAHLWGALSKWGTCCKIQFREKRQKMTCRVKMVCSQFESNLSHMIITLTKIVIFMKIYMNIFMCFNMLKLHYCRRSWI